MESATSPVDPNPGRHEWCIYESGTTTDSTTTTTTTNTTITTTDGTTTDTTSGTGTTTTTTTDPTATEPTDTSSTTGTEPVCGDGVLEGREDCDDGDENGNDQACTANCKVAVCGDGLVRAGVEDCDGDGLGNGGETATCNVDCTKAACGDGKLNKSANEECDDANTDDDDGCSSTCEYEPLRVFLTSEEKYRGDLSNNMMQDPLEFADSECQMYATAAGLDGTFMAWLSDGTSGAFERMPFPEGFFEYDKGIVLAATGDLVASSWEALLVAEPTLEHAIDTDEFGKPYVEDEVYVWTHTSSKGTTVEWVPCPKDPDSRSPWTSANFQRTAVLGKATAIDSTWTQAGDAQCSNIVRLYCFELPPPPEPAP